MHQRSLFFGCSVEFHVVLYLVQPEGGFQIETARENNDNEDGAPQNEFLLLRTTHSKFLLHPAGAAGFKAGGEVGLGAVETAEDDVAGETFG